MFCFFGSFCSCFDFTVVLLMGFSSCLDFCIILVSLVLSFSNVLVYFEG